MESREQRGDGARDIMWILKDSDSPREDAIHGAQDTANVKVFISFINQLFKEADRKIFPILDNLQVHLPSGQGGAHQL